MKTAKITVPLKGRLWLELPYSPNNREIIKAICGDRTRPDWNKAEKRWEIARSYLGPTIEYLSATMPRLIVIRYHNPNEPCSPSCMGAKGPDCTCSCLRRNHGGKEPKGIIPGEDDTSIVTYVNGRLSLSHSEIR